MNRPLAAAAAFALLLAGCAGPAPRTSPSVLRPTVLSTEAWSFGDADGTLTRTANYRLFSTDKDPVLREHLPVFLEECLTRYTSELGRLPPPPMKLDTFLMADRRQWEGLTRQLMREHAGTYLRIQRGGFSSGGRAILFSIGRRDTFAIAAHEGWHQYTQRTFRGELPAWLEEGIGVYFEGLRFDEAAPDLPIASPLANLERFDQLAQAHGSGSLIPLREVLTATPQDLIAAGAEGTLTWYAQVWALTLYLHEHHGPALRALLADAAHGTLEAGIATRLPRARRGTPTDAFTAYFGSPKDCEAGYLAFVRGLARADRARIAAGEHQ